MSTSNQTRFNPEDWTAFWKWEADEDNFSKKILAKVFYGVIALMFVIGLFTDKILAFAAVGTALMLTFVIGFAFKLNQFMRNRLLKGEPVVTFSSSGYKLGRRFLPWPSPPLVEIRAVSEHDFPNFLVLAIETESMGNGIQTIHIPFSVQDRELRSFYRDELKRKAGLEVAGT